MEKDKRYKNVKELINSGRIKTIKDIFDTKAISRHRVYKDLGLNNARFNYLLDNVAEFELLDLFRMAEFIEIDENKICELACYQWQKGKNVSAKGRKRRTK